MKFDLINQIVEPLRKRSKWWFVIWFILLFIVPYLLIQIQASIINGVNSGALTSETIFSIYTNTTNPSTSSLYLTNYVHKFGDGGSHIINNIEAYFVIAILIFFCETFFLFSNDLGRSEKIFYYSVFLFFFIFPFLISGTSLIIFRLIGGTGFNGFSGIIAAFLGYFWFLLYNYYFLLRENAIQKSPHRVKLMDYFLISCFFIPILIYIFKNLSSYDNFGGHTIGYLLGFFSAYGMYLARKKKCDKIILALLFAIIIFITSTFWIFF